jgi:hypothetical protein
MLGIAWSSHPLPDNHTAPGCMLRFDVRGVGHASSVTVSFTYADVTSPDPVVVYTGATFFTDTHQASKVGALEAFDAPPSSMCIPPNFFSPAARLVSGLCPRSALHAMCQSFLACMKKWELHPFNASNSVWIHTASCEF